MKTQTKERKRDGNLEVGAKESTGICDVCRNNTSCTYFRFPKWPVVQCDEFTPFEPMYSKLNGTHEDSAPDPIIRTAPERFRRLQRIV